MKKYMQPLTSALPLQMEQMIAESMQFSTDGETGTTSLHEGGAQDAAMTRHRGFGNGLWEDMK